MLTEESLYVPFVQENKKPFQQKMIGKCIVQMIIDCNGGFSKPFLMGVLLKEVQTVVRSKLFDNNSMKKKCNLKPQLFLPFLFAKSNWKKG